MSDDQPQGSDPRTSFRDEVSEEEIAEIEAERERRLAPENRPENSEVDNTHLTFEDLPEGFEETETKGSDPRKRFRDIEVSEAELAEIEAERERRLAPENRPENSEVDNTHR